MAKSVKNVINKTLLYVSLGILVLGLIFTMVIVFSGIKKSFDATKDESKATSSPVADWTADCEV